MIDDLDGDLSDAWNISLRLSRFFPCLQVGDLRREGIARLQIGPPEECEGLQMFQMSTGTFK